MALSIKDIKKSCDIYGPDTTLQSLLKIVQGEKIYECPKCSGDGYITEEYNAYPKNLPDSGFVYEPGYKKIDCDLCGGEGYTEVEYRPKMIQDGWEAVEHNNKDD